MSKRLLDELSKLKYSKLEQIDNNHFIIKKENKIRLELDNCYLIELSNSLFIPNSILSSNWNKGKLPLCRYYQVDVQQVMANMVKVAGVGYDSQDCVKVKDNWLGWFPIDEIKVVKKL